MTRRGLLSCVFLPGAVRPWCSGDPLAMERDGRWTGLPPNPAVSAWHSIRPPVGDPLPMWWDARVSAWRYAPGNDFAMAPEEVVEDGKRYGGAR